jgi:hypothetical protein
MPSPEECRATASDLCADHPDLSRAQVARRAVKTARRWAVATGAATGVVANPLMMLPAAAAELAAMLRIEGKMVGVIAALLDEDALKNYDKFQADVLSLVFPMAAVQALQQLGVRGAQQATRALIRGVLDRGLLPVIIRIILKYLGWKLTRKAIISKTVPVVGAGIGAAWNWVEVQSLGRRAIGYYTGRAEDDPL